MIKKIIDKIRPELETYIIWVLSSLVNVAALSLWALFQYGFDVVISMLELTGLNAWIFLALQIFSAISTLAPIAFFIYRDIRVIWIQTQLEIEKEVGPVEPPRLSPRTGG